MHMQIRTVSGKLLFGLVVVLLVAVTARAAGAVPDPRPVVIFCAVLIPVVAVLRFTRRIS